MIELNVEQQMLPVITTNFEIVKASLTESIAKYKNMIVTEDGLKGCKADKKKLAGMRNKIDDYRKTVKSELLVPITNFEDNCKVLIGLIEDAEKPLNDGIEVFNEKIREANRVAAETLIKEAIADNQLNEKYASQLLVLDKYTKLSAKAKDTKTDISDRAFILLQEQEREVEAIRVEKERVAEALRLETERIAELAKIEAQRRIELAAAEEKRKVEHKAAEVIRIAENLEIAKSTIEQANTQIKQQILLEDFIGLVNNGAPAMNIIDEINKRKYRIIKLETPKVEPKIEPKAEIIEEIVKKEPIKSQSKPTLVKRYSLTIKTEGNMDEVVALSKFLRDNNYKYEVIDQGTI